MQIPNWHVDPAGQLFPQAPQLKLSVCKLAQIEKPQIVWAQVSHMPPLAPRIWQYAVQQSLFWLQSYPYGRQETQEPWSQ